MALEQLLAQTQDKLDLGSALSASAQSGSTIAQNFRQADATMLAARQQAVTEQSIAFETAVRAGKSLGEGVQRQLDNKVKARQMDQEDLRLRQAASHARLRALELGIQSKQFGLEYGAGRSDAYRTATTSRRQENARRKFMGQPELPMPSQEEFGIGTTDNPLFGGSGGDLNSGQGALEFQEAGAPPTASVTNETIGDLRTTVFNRKEPTADEWTKLGIGSWGENKITKNAIALSPDVAKAIGAKPGDLLKYTT